MSSIFRLISAAAVVLAASAALAQPSGPLAVPAVPGLSEPARAAASSIDPEKIRAHVRFLALDELEGRGPGSRGDRIAAEYIATQFALDGLKPAGDNGTFFQQVPLVAVHTLEDKTRFAFVPAQGQPVDLAYSTEIVSKDQTGAATADFDAPIVFVGYGIHAPEYNWDDYQGVDLKGKVALVIVNEPPSTDPKFFAAAALTYYGRWTYKYEEAARRGALGVLLIHRTDLAAYGWDVVRNSQSIEKSYLADDPAARLRAAAWIQHDVAQRLLTLSGLGDLDRLIAQAGKPGAFHPVELPVRLRAHVESRVRRYNSTNVLAVLPGAEATPSKAVVFSGHYDHLGLDPSIKGDGIYNGAADNGTGVGILLELARAWSTLRSAQPIYFASVTAEEQGLLGSQFLGEHPPLRAGQIALDLNYDMILPLGLPLETDANGAERLNFWPAVQSTVQAFGLTLVPDPNPGAGHYYRSDHFSLSRSGIPAFSIGEGELFQGRDRAWGHAQFADYVAHRYHQPADEYQPSWDFRGNARLAQLGFVLGWLAQSQPARVEWQPGDEFESARRVGEAQK